jgi:archaellum component FlaC
MFSALNQGSTIYILDKTDGFKYKVGTVTSISAPRTNYNASLNVQNPTVIDIKC